VPPPILAEPPGPDPTFALPAPEPALPLEVFGDDAAYGAMTLSPGFEPDPVTIALQAGGSVDLSSLALGVGCVGWAAARPDLIVDFQGWGFRLRFHAASDRDTALVVLDPSGTWHCDDDAGGNGNPDLTIEPALPGAYRVWVTTFAEGNAEATLNVTERTATGF
jgi:hypothetical protein